MLSIKYVQNPITLCLLCKATINSAVFCMRPQKPKAHVTVGVARWIHFSLLKGHNKCPTSLNFAANITVCRWNLHINAIMWSVDFQMNNNNTTNQIIHVSYEYIYNFVSCMYHHTYSIKFLSDICCTGTLQVEGYYRYLLFWGESSRIVIINSIIIYNKYKIDYVINHIVY